VRRVITLALLIGACLSLVACAQTDSSGTVGDASGDNGSPSGVVDAPSDVGPIEVPDVSGEDGADAVSDVEAASLTATLADANDDPGFDSSRDASGCEVTDQDPAAGDGAEHGDEVTITMDCSEVDWENQEGPAWDAFSDSYAAGFDDGCQALFDQSPNGSLYEDDYEYTVADCQSYNPGDASAASDLPGDVPDDPEADGADLGNLDGCQALFENDGVYTLNYGQDSYTEHDCPVDISAGAAPAPTQTKKRKSSTPAGAADTVVGQTCSGTEADGTPVVITVAKGVIKCTGAVALLNEWLRRAPDEGVGSGGAMTLYGWVCVGATATQAPRIGTCERRGRDAASFSASLKGE
jgi:hypothetical protein